MSGEDAHLALLQKIDRQGESHGAQLIAIRVELANGRVTFAEHHARIATVEKDQASCNERVKQSVREVLNEQRETDRVERTERKKPEKSPGETTGLIKSITKLGPWIKYIIVAGAFVGGLIGGIYVTAKPTKSPQSESTSR